MKQGFISGYYFDIDPALDVLKDPYLSLGSKGPAIEKDVEYFYQLHNEDCLPIRLTSPAAGDTSTMENEYYFFIGIARYLNIDKEQEILSLYKEINEEGKLPDQIVHMRQLYLMSQTLLAPTRTYIAQGLGNLLGAGLHMLEDVQLGGLLAGETNIGISMYKSSIKQIIKKIQKERGPIKFTVKMSWFGYGDQFVVEPYNLALQDFSDPIPVGDGGNRFAFQHPRLYQGNGEEIKDQLIQSTLFEQAVSREPFDLVNDEGSRSYTDRDIERNIKYWRYGVNGKTQLEIMREKLLLMGLSSDVIQELQLMSTGKETRVKETIGKLFKHLGLLNEGKCAPILQRLFDRNLFRDNALINELLRDPSYSSALFEMLRDAANKQKGAHQYRSYLYVIDLMRRVHDSMEYVGKRLESEELSEAKTAIGKYLEEAHEAIHEMSQKADQGDLPYAGYQREFHLHRLLALEYRHEHGDLISLDDLQNALKSFCLLQSLPAAHSVNLDQEERIAYFMHKIRPDIKQLMENEEKRNVICNHLMKFLYPNERENFEWRPKGNSGFLFKSGSCIIDVKEGVFWKNGVRQTTLPKGILKHPDFEIIEKILKESGFDEDLSMIPASLRVVEKKGISGRRFDFSLSREGESVPHRLIITDDQVLRLYKKTGSGWYQLQTEIVSPQTDAQSKMDQAKDFLSGRKAPERFPRELQSLACWIKDDGSSLIAEEKGKVVYRGRLKGSPPRITSLKHIETGQEVINPWKKARFRIFKSLDDPAHITVKGKQGRAGELNYHRFNLKYQWSDEKKAWISPQHPGYQLSTRTLREYFTRDDNPEESVAPYDLSELREVFSGSFDQYQLLESENGWPKVMLSGFELSRIDPEKNKFVLHLQKRSKRTHQVFDVDKKDKVPLFAFTADPNRGLVCDDVPDGYLYLAYSLFAQGKYKEAIRYLKKADINRPFSSFGNEVLGWIQNFSDQSEGAAAFKMHVTLMLTHQAEMVQGTAKSGQAAQQLGLAMAMQLKQYHALVNAGKIPLEWQLKDQELTDFCRYAEKSIYYVGFKLFENIEKLQPLIQSGIPGVNLNGSPELLSMLNELHITFPELCQWYSTGILQKLLAGDADPKKILDEFVAYEIKDKTRLKASLNAEIKELQQIVDRRKENLGVISTPPKTALENPIRILPIEFNNHFQEVSGEESKTKDWKALKSRFREAVTFTGVEDADPYAKEIGKELAEDLDYELNQQGTSAFTCKPDEVSTLLQDIEATQKKRLDNARRHKLALIQQLPRLPKESSRWGGFLKQIRQQGETWQEVMADTALRCCGEDDWTVFADLFDSEDSFNKAVPLLKESCREYLKESVAAQYLANAKNLAYQLKNPDLKQEDYQKKSQELYQMLQGGWSYDPDLDADALSFLLIEYELGFICRPSQVDVIRASIDKTQFKQEICGGGKTTVLRNVIAHILADGVTLSAISTLEPLRREHSLLFSRTTAHAYGQKSIDFVFNRQSLSDEASLLKIHRNLLKMIVERGRVDLTKGDLLSFKLEMILKQEKLAKLLEDQEENQEQITMLNRELDIMENVRDLFKEHAVINADELDKDCDATQEKIYAHGDKVSFNEYKIEAGVELMKGILGAKTPALMKLKRALQSNTQSNLRKEEIDQARLDLAGQIFDEYAEDLNWDDNLKNEFIGYITEINTNSNVGEEAFQAGIKDFFDRYIDPTDSEDTMYPLKSKICFMHEFLTQIAPHAFTKKGGVDFGRSEDLIHVIPFSGSDIPKQGSEHGLESEQIWYALMDYIDLTRGGVSPEQISQLVQNFRESALNEVDNSLKLTPDSPILFHKTEAAMCFQENFNQSLESVNEDDFVEISEKINTDPAMLLDFISHWVLSEYDLSSKNIVSDSQDPPDMVRQYGGSSGTDYAKYSMPDSIDTSDVRQMGVHGKIVGSMLAIHDDLGGKSFLSYSKGPLVNWNPNLLQTDFSNLKPGDELYRLQEVFDQYLPKGKSPPTLYRLAEAIAKQNPSVNIAIHTKSKVILYNNSAKRGVEPIHIALDTPEGKLPGILETLAVEIKGGDCLSDAGIAFPGIPAVQIARNLSRKRPELTIRFMTRNHEWKMFKDGKVIPVDRNIPLDQVFTIFDDTHTRGAERPSMEGVTEYVTIDTNSSWANVEQGVLRERGVAKRKASVRYLISPALMEKWDGAPSMEKLFALLIENEAAQLKSLNMKGEKQKIRAIARHGIEEAGRKMTHKYRKEQQNHHHKARAIIYSMTQQYFVRSNEAGIAAAGAPNGKIKGEDSLELLALNELEKVEELIADKGPLMKRASVEGGETEQMIAEFCRLVKENVIPRLEAKLSTELGEDGFPPRIAGHLIPAYVSGKEGELDMEQSVEQEQEQEQEMAVAQEIEQETSVQGRGETEEIPHAPLDLQNIEWPYICAMLFEGKMIGKYERQILPMNQYAAHMPEGKYFTENFLPVFRDRERGVKPWTVTEFGENFPPDQNRVSRTLFVIDTNTGKVAELIPSLKDNDTDIEKYVRDNQESAAERGVLFSIYNYDADRVDGGAGWEDLPPEIARNINKQIVATKFFNGQTVYGRFQESDPPETREVFLNQYDALVNWLASCGAEINDLERSFRKFVRQHRISCTFEGSDIHRAFIDARKRLL